jgi:hypothetical protein
MKTILIVNNNIDYISNKMLKYAGPKLIEEIFSLFANIHDTEKIHRKLWRKVTMPKEIKINQKII